MITLYVFGPNFGLPDPSPFVLKTTVQLKMVGLPYRTVIGQIPEAPKGKLPYIVDGALTLGDSAFIRSYLEQKSGIDLDQGLDTRERALSWAAERMLEDHLYWAILHHRWLDAENFARGPAHFFDGAPEAMRDKVRADAVERVRERLHGHGLGRHSPAEIGELGTRSLTSLSALLGDRPYLFGTEPKAADATAFCMVASAAVPLFAGPLADAAQSDRRLMAYRDRMLQRFFPDFAAAA